MNLGSLSDVIILVIPVLYITLFQKRIAMSISESSLKHGTKIEALEYLSTTTRNKLKLEELTGDREVSSRWKEQVSSRCQRWL